MGIGSKPPTGYSIIALCPNPTCKQRLFTVETQATFEPASKALARLRGPIRLALAKKLEAGLGIEYPDFLTCDGCGGMFLRSDLSFFIRPEHQSK